MKKILVAAFSAVFLSTMPSLGADSDPAPRDIYADTCTSIKRGYSSFKKDPLKHFSTAPSEVTEQMLINKKLEVAAYAGAITDLMNLLDPEIQSLLPDQTGLNSALAQAAISPFAAKEQIIYHLYDNEAKIHPNQDGANNALISVAKYSRSDLYKLGGVDTILSGITLLMSPLICGIVPDRITIDLCYCFLNHNRGTYSSVAQALLVPPYLQDIFMTTSIYICNAWDEIPLNIHPILAVL